MFIVKYSTILSGYRNLISRLHPKLKELHKCSLCLGFWVGVLIMIFEIYYQPTLQHRLFLLPLISAGVCWFVDNLNNTLQSVEIKIDRDLDL
jgi:hypothetical protein